MQRSKKRKSKPARSVVVGAPLASAILLVLQSAQAQEPTGLEEIIVTAQKRGEESLQDVPMSIQAISTERLEELNITKFDDYVKFLPSVSYPDVRSRLRARVHARRRERRRRQPFRAAALGRHLSRRAAHHDDHGRARSAPLRHSARRGARGAAGHALRRELAGGHDPHHHQQAGSVRVLGELRPRAQHRQRGRRGLSRRRATSTSRSATAPPSASSAGRARTPATSTTCRCSAPGPAARPRSRRRELHDGQHAARGGGLQRGRHLRRACGAARRPQR